MYFSSLFSKKILFLVGQSDSTMPEKKHKQNLKVTKLIANADNILRI